MVSTKQVETLIQNFLKEFSSKHNLLTWNFECLKSNIQNIIISGRLNFVNSAQSLVLLTAHIHNYFAACVITLQKPQTFNIYSVVSGRRVHCGRHMLIRTLRLQRMIHRTLCGRQDSSSWNEKLFKLKNWKREIHKHYLDPGTHKNKVEILITIKYRRLINRSLDTNYVLHTASLLQKNNILMVFGEIVAACCENYKKKLIY